MLFCAFQHNVVLFCTILYNLVVLWEKLSLVGTLLSVTAPLLQGCQRDRYQNKAPMWRIRTASQAHNALTLSSAILREVAVCAFGFSTRYKYEHCKCNGATGRTLGGRINPSRERCPNFAHDRLGGYAPRFWWHQPHCRVRLVRNVGKRHVPSRVPSDCSPAFFIYFCVAVCIFEQGTIAVFL